MEYFSLRDSVSGQEIAMCFDSLYCTTDTFPGVTFQPTLVQSQSSSNVRRGASGSSNPVCFWYIQICIYARYTGCLDKLGFIDLYVIKRVLELSQVLFFTHSIGSSRICRGSCAVFIMFMNLPMVISHFLLGKLLFPLGTVLSL